MDVSLLIRRRLNELQLEQKDLAAAAQVTESYISQLLARKKAPPAPARTDIYDRIAAFLRVPVSELSKLADLQRQEELKKKVAAPPQPLFKEVRELILQKCAAAGLKEVRRIFEKESFGELERLVTQKLLDVAQGVARDELRSEERLRVLAQVSNLSYEQMRMALQEFLDTDVLNVSLKNCVFFLDTLIESWDVDLKSFGMEIVLNKRLAPGGLKRFEFVERQTHQRFSVEPGLEHFLDNKSLSGDATAGEIEFLKALQFNGRRPAPIYYYRELQNLRDPLHFTTE